MTEDQNDQTNEGPLGDPDPGDRAERCARDNEPGGDSAAGRDSPGVGAAPSAPPAARHPPDGLCARSDATGQLDPARRAPTPWALWPATRCSVRHRHPRSALLRPPTPGPPCGRRPRRLAQRVAAATTASGTVFWQEPPPLRSSAPASASAMQRRTTVEARRPSARRRAARACLRVPGPQAARTPRGAPAPRGVRSATAALRRLRQLGSSGNSGSGSSGSSGSSGPSDVNAIASKVDPGLVDINTTLGYQQEQAAGTGIVLSSNGVILTNNHVIDGATSISVTDVGNNKTYTASVVGYDRTKDIAVLQLHNASGLQTATLGNSSNASVGQDVVGVGNAGGTGGTPSAVGGTVTALNQSITASDDGDGTSEQLSGLIETNADIQPGDSGGSLVNTSGEVIGMDTAASAGTSFQFNGDSSGTQGFAIPIDTALSIARAIEAGSGSSTVHIGETAFLGVEINAASSSSQATAAARTAAAASEASSAGTPAARAAPATPGPPHPEPRWPARSRTVPPRRPAWPRET